MSSDEKKKGSSKQIVFLAAIVVIVLAFGASFFIKGKSSPHKIITTGDRAPDFTLPAPNGRSVSLSDFNGKVVMVHFWATWCPPCVEELPTLATLNESMAGKDFEMLAVSVDEGGADAVTSFMHRNNLNIPVLLDSDRATASRYGTYKFPETYILDRQGIVRYKAIGSRDWRDPVALQMLQKLIASR